jgi:hypothetical protein
MFVRILIGVILVALGAVLVIRTNSFMDFFGSMDWADRYLGGGGSRLMYKLIGIVLCLVGFMVATNLWNAFLQATLGSLLPNFGGAKAPAVPVE